jgi:phage shock protein A
LSQRYYRNEEATMGKLLHRLKAGLDTILAPAVDPRIAFASTYERQRELLTLARLALADLAVTRGQLEARMQELQEQISRQHQQAQHALAAGQENLARLALRRRQIATAESRAIEQQVQELRQKEQLLALHEERLATQVEAVEARVNIIAASYSAAEAQARISEAFSDVSVEMSDLSRVLEQAERHTEDLRSRTAAITTLVEDDLVETELAALKSELAEHDTSPV